MKTQKLLSPLFLSSLFLLLLNDWVLKASFHNELTGKLSDVAGLFAFPFFFAVFFPKRVKAIYIFTFFFFLYWKSPWSQGLIDFWNGLSIFSIQRVVDYSDYGAFLVLPFSYQYFKKTSYHFSIPKFALLNYMIIVVSLIAFVATTTFRIPTLTLEKSIKEKYKFENKPYPIKLPKSTIQTFLRRYDFRNSQLELSDSIFQVFYNISSSQDLDVKVLLQEINDVETNIILLEVDSLYQYVYHSKKELQEQEKQQFLMDKTLPVQDSIIKIFEENIIETLQTPHQIDSLETIIKYLRVGRDYRRLIPSLRSQFENHRRIVFYEELKKYLITQDYFLYLYEIPLLYLQIGSYIEAQKSALEAIKNSPQELDVIYKNFGLSKNYIEKHDTSEVLITYLPLNTLAYAQLMQGKLKEAQKNIRQAKRYYPENVYTQFNQAVYFSEKRKYKKSLEIFEALASKPEKALHFYFHYGKTLYVSGQKQKAEDIWQQTEDTFEKQMIEEFKN